MLQRAKRVCFGGVDLAVPDLHTMTGCLVACRTTNLGPIGIEFSAILRFERTLK